MSSIQVDLPPSLHRQLAELASAEGVAINQLVAAAVAEKVAALMSAEYLNQRAARGSRELFEQVLSKAGDEAPMPGDEWPPHSPPSD